MDEPNTRDLEFANRLYLADLRIARDTLARTQVECMKVQRQVNEAFDRVRELEAVGITPYMALVAEVRAS